jgi:hypothetical protein
MLTVDALAQEIRRVDGSNSLGAGALAEALMPFLEATGEARPVAVKALEWEESDGNYTGQTVWSPKDDIWPCWIVKNPDNDRYVWCEEIGIEYAPASPVMGVFSTLPEAKAAAQADFERRILSCLSHPAQGWREDAVERAVRAWAYEEYYLAGGGVGSWHEKLSFNKPKDGRLDIRSIAPLYVAPPEGGVAQDLLAAIKQLMPSNLGSLPATMPDSATLPLDVTFGELRQAIAAIAKAEGRSDA